MKIEPHIDDVVTLDPDATVMSSRTLRMSELPQNLKQIIEQSDVNTISDIFDTWLSEGVECEFLRASTGGGWQTGRLRIRFEFAPDVPEKVQSNDEPGTSDAVLSPNFESGFPWQPKDS